MRFRPGDAEDPLGVTLACPYHTVCLTMHVRMSHHHVCLYVAHVPRM